jgi:oligoribonuclease
MKLLWLDVETTGLDPLKHRLLEVACFVTDLATPWHIESPLVQCVLPVAEGEDSTFDPFILNMHTKNGLLLACKERDHEMIASECPPTKMLSLPWRARQNHALGQLSDLISLIIPDQAEMIAKLGKEEARNHTTALAGSSVHFDLSFLRVHLPLVAKNLSHRVYDVSAIKLFCRSLGMPKPPPEEVHRALPDCEESRRHAMLCADWLGKEARNLPLPLGGES